MSSNYRSRPMDPKGSALVVVLLVMTAISILGIMSINTSSVELDVVRNEREIRELFYLAESVAMEGVQRLVDTPMIDLEDKIQCWHHSIDIIHAQKLDFRDPQNWDVDGKGQDNGMPSALNQDVFFAAVEHRIASGSSAIVTDSRLYMNQVFGLSKKYNTTSLVEIGYYLRY